MTITYKVFAAGDTLTANDLLDYIENQVVVQVDNEAELATVHSTYPDVRVAFAEDTDKLYVKDDGVWNPVVAGVSPTLTNLTLTGNLTVQGTTTTIDSATIAVKDKFVFEGATADAHETTLQVAEPTADRTVTIPDATTTLVGTDATQTLTNKTISGANNTLSAIGNASLTNSSITMDGTPVSLGGTFTSPSITGKTDKSTLDATGAMYYASAANTPAKLAIGTANDVLRVSSGGIPEWAAPAGGGKVLQVVSANLSSETSMTNSNETDTGLTLNITPSSASSKILILVTQSVAQTRSENQLNAQFFLYRDATAIYQTSSEQFWVNAVGATSMALGALQPITFLDSPNTTSAVTYKTRGRRHSGSGTLYFQYNSSTSTITLLEIGA